MTNQVYSLEDLGKPLMAMTQVEVSRVLNVAKQMAVSDVKNNFQKSRAPDGTPWVSLAWPRPGGPGKPLYDTGVLMNSIRATVSGGVLSVFTDVAYAGLHQYGGTIRPVRAKKLAIPVTREAKRAGSPRKMTGLQFAMFPSGKGIAHTQQGTGNRASRTVHFVLVDEVTVPARPFLGFSPAFVQRLGRLFADELQRAGEQMGQDRRPPPIQNRVR